MRLPRRPAARPRAAGIGFVGYSLRGFCISGAALGAIVAGTVAEQVMLAGATLPQFKYLIVGLVAVTLVLFIAPLLAFMPKLLATWRRGVREYGELANLTPDTRI